jgi:large subunit ribosomal protein L4
MSKLSLNVYARDGKDAAVVALPEELFGVKWNADFMHGIITGMQANARHSTAHTKDRAAVSGGGKKPWKQKGTGRARHGSNRSPIWVGGGVTHGPTNEKDYSVKINRKERIRALFMALSQKLSDGRVIGVSDLGVETGKTRDAHQTLVALQKAPGFATLTHRNPNNVLVIMPEGNDQARKAMRNLAYGRAVPVSRLSALDIMKYRYVIVAEPKDVVEKLAARRAARLNTKTA